MNFVFLSPQFPHTYWNFCDRLHKNGVNVLGIGDTPYDQLSPALKAALTEYYRVDSLEDYNAVFRAVAFFSFKYGKIDWLESNNEYWLAQDARLRQDFHITTGAQPADVQRFQSKSKMKLSYAKAGLPTARCHKLTTLQKARQFAQQTGFPLIAKPDVGVGAAATCKLDDAAALEAFLAAPRQAPYVLEEFVEGDICSYDAIVDSRGDPLFESMTVWPPSIMDIVNKKLDLAYYVDNTMPEPLRQAGRAAVHAFGVKSRFVHLEFFRLKKARKGLGEVGDFVALEVNMRPAGGYTPDMMNFAHSIDVYQIWADMVTQDRRLVPAGDRAWFCAYASRRDVHRYLYSHQEILDRYGSRLVMCERMPDILSGAMGNQMYTVRLDTLEQVREFTAFVHRKA